MRQGLQLKFSQQLKMTPQLQQAIKLLQLSTLDLQQEIIEQLYNNPLLESDEEATSHEQSTKDSSSNKDVDLSDDSDLYLKAQDASEPSSTEHDGDSQWEKPNSEELLSESWNDVANTTTKTVSSDNDFNFDSVYQVTESLQDHLRWQLNLVNFSIRDKAIAEAYVDSVDDNGFISKDLQGITSYIDNETSEEPLQEDELIAVVSLDAPVKVKNIFKQIETKIVKPDNRRRGRRRFDKKGGGRQKQEKRLNRQKYLEYKYAARDILDNPDVPEEHRSNVLGQIWAKGERVSIEESLTFIEQKQAELVLPEAVADSLRDLVKRMTTRR